MDDRDDSEEQEVQDLSDELQLLSCLLPPSSQSAVLIRL